MDRFDEMSDDEIAMAWVHCISNLREKTGLVEIPLQHTHKCEGTCLNIVERVMDDGTSGMRLVESKCDKNGVIEDTVVHIDSFTPDDFSESSVSCRKSPILNGDEIVIEDMRINIEFDYPMDRTATFSFSSATGFTRKKLVELIVATYKQIYSEEENSVRDRPVVPVMERGPCLNRNKTDGIYGIAGHDLEDLWLEEIKYHRASCTVILGIGS